MRTNMLQKVLLSSGWIRICDDQKQGLEPDSVLNIFKRKLNINLFEISNDNDLDTGEGLRAVQLEGVRLQLQDTRRTLVPE